MIISLTLAFLNIFFIHIVKRKFPRHYFSLGQIIIKENEDITFRGVMTKFFPPFVISYFIGLLNSNNSLEMSLIFTFFASFLVIWPVVLSKEELLSWEALKKINILYVIYFLYVSQYMILGLFGNFLGQTTKNGINNFSFLKYVSLYEQQSILVQNIIGGVIGSAIFSVIIFTFNSIYKFTFRKLRWAMAEDERKRLEAYGDNK